MTGTIALIAAILFGGLAAYRLVASAPAWTPRAAAAVALAAGLFAVAHWQATGDTRWAVGAALMIVAAVLCFIGRTRGATIGAMVAGDLGLVLMIVATMTGFGPR